MTKYIFVVNMDGAQIFFDYATSDSAHLNVFQKYILIYNSSIYLYLYLVTIYNLSKDKVITLEKQNY